MAPALGITPHVRSAAEACHIVLCCCGRIAVTVNLHSGSDKHICRIVACRLAESPVRTHRSVRSDGKNIRSCFNIFFHAYFRAERVKIFRPSCFNRRDHGGVRIQYPVSADLSPKSKAFPIGRKNKFNGTCIKTDSVVQYLDAIFAINSLYSHHGF